MTIRQTTFSPTSVRCSLDKGTRRSLASALKTLDPLSSDSEHSTFDTSSACNSTASSSPSSFTSVRRKVRFLPLVRAKDTISRHDMTEDEIQRCFLQDDEYDEIWDRNKRLVRRAKNYHSTGLPLPSPLPKKLEGFEDDVETKPDGGSYLCTRGLESASKSQRRKSIECVLAEQDFQILEGYYDEEALSEIYSHVTSSCRFRAVYLAMEDRIDASGESQQAAVDELKTINGHL